MVVATVSSLTIVPDALSVANRRAEAALVDGERLVRFDQIVAVDRHATVRAVVPGAKVSEPVPAA